MASPIQIASTKRPESRPRGKILALAILCGGILGLDLLMPRLSAPLRTLVLTLTTPAIETVDAINHTLQTTVQAVADTLTAPRRIAALEQEIAALQDARLTAQALTRENQELQQALKTLPPAPLKFVTARLLPGTQGLWHVRFKGTDVAHGMAAVQENRLVGLVWQVGSETATLLPLSDPRSRVPVVAQQSGADVILAGTGDMQHLAIRYTAGDRGLLAGEALYTATSGNLFPAGIPVATVAMDGDGNLYAAPLAQLAHVGWVQLIRYHAPLMVATTGALVP